MYHFPDASVAKGLLSQADPYQTWTAIKSCNFSVVHTMSKALEGAKNLKLNEALPYAQKYAQENLTPTKLRGGFNKWWDSYSTKHIDTGSPQPFYHLIGYGFALSYLVALPAVGATVAGCGVSATPKGGRPCSADSLSWPQRCILPAGEETLAT